MVRRLLTRASSPGTPNPGRKQKPDRLSQRISWRGDFLRPAANSMSTSPNRRMAEIGHESLFAPSAASIWLTRVSGASVAPSAEPPKTPADQLRSRFDSCIGSRNGRRTCRHGLWFHRIELLRLCLFVAQFELQPPAMRRVPRFTPEFERTNLRETGSETYSQVHVAHFLAVAQQGH